MAKASFEQKLHWEDGNLPPHREHIEKGDELVHSFRCSGEVIWIMKDKDGKYYHTVSD